MEMMCFDILVITVDKRGGGTCTVIAQRKEAGA